MKLLFTAEVNVWIVRTFVDTPLLLASKSTLSVANYFWKMLQVLIRWTREECHC